MRTITLIGLTLAGLALTSAVRADDAATFEERWPDTTLRQATDVEAARLIASVVRTDIKPLIREKLLARIERSVSCSTVLCDPLSLR